MQTGHFPRHIAVLVLAGLACAFAGNHIAARIAFDDGAGLLLAILCRSGVTALALAVLVCVGRQPLRLGPEAARWQLLMGCLVGIQSFCIYSAVALIPVGLALLVVNLSPVVLVLFTWLLGGPAPSRRALLIMAGIFCGLLVALDVPAALATQRLDLRWTKGVLFSLAGAMVFAGALWISENRLSRLPGTLRSMLTMALVFSCAALAGAADVVPGGLTLPRSAAGWSALAFLVLLYGMAFSTLFVFMPRLDIARNAPVMNAEPIAGLMLGWLVLGQQLGALQLLGGAMVVGGIVLLAYRRQG
ncbi:Threonine/homoserine efflux transporter RhtA [Pseudomonas delhiensis]|uniref:Threonine/homoserine efflux transporter RhtA n=1 Tax=Pseudomonas delhiensis TaxID=366289 RepID=A0A239KBM7_9PSED|nr:DMT family transporter [Pseudomonas delhiensis]SDJ33817.1 Threonine/homoserine efflux transporter RhtA [Pseudomonas delhiensis]SNT14514.1 Threonine/homoserine efflux transporter RhtA [Pseudomonas delhiensis]